MNIVEQLKKDEGYRKRMYLCSAGHETIGYGYNLKANPLNLSSIEIAQAYTKGINLVEAERLLKLMISQCRQQLEALPFFNALNSSRQDCLINMCFNLGMRGLIGFKKTLLLIEAGEYSQASIEMLKSKWSADVGIRATRLAEQMRSGVYAAV